MNWRVWLRARYVPDQLHKRGTLKRAFLIDLSRGQYLSHVAPFFTNFTQDELEQELERLKEKLSRNQRKSSKNVSETVDDAVVCEICEQKGHDIFGCDVLKGEATSSRPVSVMSGQSSEKELYCEDCGERGHSVTECPHSMDVF